jgi:predicted PolB exonuclease-like 3'-5' exonuclease
MKHNTFVFDIETIPSQIPGLRDELAAAIHPPGNYSKPDTIAKWEVETKPGLIEEAYLSTSFDGGLGQICAIAFALNDDAPTAYAVDDLSTAAERKVLEHFFCAVEDAGAGTVFVGHNLVGFDIRFVWQRAMVLGVRPPFCFPRDPKPWSELSFDTMTAWAGVKDRVSMDKLCRAFGIPTKGGITGADVWPLVRAGRIAEVAAYCCGDVRRTRAIYRRMTFADVLAADLEAA